MRPGGGLPRIRRVSTVPPILLLLALALGPAGAAEPRLRAGIVRGAGVEVAVLEAEGRRLAIVAVTADAVPPSLRDDVLERLAPESGIDSGNLLLVATGSGEAPGAERIAGAIESAAGQIASAVVRFGRTSIRGLVSDPSDPAGPLDEALFTLDVRAGASLRFAVLPASAPVPAGVIPMIGSGGEARLSDEDGELSAKIDEASRGALALVPTLAVTTTPVGSDGVVVQRIEIGVLTILAVPGELSAGLGSRCRAVEAARSKGPVVLLGRANATPAKCPEPGLLCTALGLSAALPKRDFRKPSPVERTEVIRTSMPGGYRVERVFSASPLPSGVPENDLVPVEYFIPRRKKATAALIILPIWKGGSLIAERTVAGNLASFGYLTAIMPLPYQFERAPKGVRSGSWTVSGDLDRTRKVMLQAVADIEELTTRLAARPDVTDGRVGVLGISLGAHVAAAVYQIDSRLKAGVFVMAGGDLASLLYRDVRETRGMRAEIEARGFTREDVEERLRMLDPAKAERYPAWPCFPRYRGVLMINAEKDTIVPPANARALHAALGHPAIHWYPEDHYSMAVRIPEILGVVRRHLEGLFR
jgi:hypothetical protein